MGMKEFAATFVGKNRVAIGSEIECDYNGKHRLGVVDKLYGNDYAVTQLSVETTDGFRRFNLSDIRNLVVK